MQTIKSILIIFWVSLFISHGWAGESETLFFINPKDVRTLQESISAVSTMKDSQSTKSVEDEKSSPQYWERQGITARRDKDYDTAISNFSKSIELNPKYASGYNERGLTYFIKRDFDKSLADFNKSIANDSTLWSVYYNRAILCFSLASVDPQQYMNVTEDLNIYISHDSSNAQSFYYLGLAHTAMSDFSEAVLDFSKAMKLDSQNKEVYYQRGNAYRLNNQDQLAIRDFKKSLELTPRDPLAYYGLAKSYEKLNDRNNAYDAYSKVVLYATQEYFTIRDEALQKMKPSKGE